MGSFSETPPIILPILNHIDFFKFVLSDVTGPEIAGFSIKRKPPGIAQAPRKNFRLTASFN